MVRNYIRYNVWVEITYPFLNFNGATIEVKERVSNFIPNVRQISFLWTS